LKKLVPTNIIQAVFSVFVFTFLVGLRPVNASENSIKSISYFIDLENEIFINTLENQNFEPLNNSLLGFNEPYFWFKIELNQSNNQSPIYFVMNETSVDFLEVYNNGKLVFEGNNEKPIFNPKIENLPIESSIFYFKVKFHNQVYFDVDVFDKAGYSKSETFFIFGNGWYYGFAFMVFVVNMFFYLSLKNEPFLSYALFLAVINIGISFFDGIIDLWVGAEKIEMLVPIVHFTVGFSGYWFATGFLNLKELYPRARFIAYGLLGLGAIFYIAYFVTGSFAFLAWGDLVTYFVLVIYWFLGLIVIKKHDFAIFFVVGYFLVMMAGLFHITPVNFGLHMFPITFGFVKFGAAFEMLILTYAITYKVKIMQEENNTIKDELKTYMLQLFSLEERMSLEISDGNSTPEITKKIDELAKEFDLTNREVDVLLCISNQSTNIAIAEELFISVNTVKYHTRNIYQKLNIKSKGDALDLLKV
jgi:DNA-binding CsgD family transcriptional regulator